MCVRPLSPPFLPPTSLLSTGVRCPSENDNSSQFMLYPTNLRILLILHFTRIKTLTLTFILAQQKYHRHINLVQTLWILKRLQ